MFNKSATKTIWAIYYKISFEFPESMLYKNGIAAKKKWK